MNPSDVERIKLASRGLRGSIVDSLSDRHSGALRADDQQLIKFHGSYQQDDRELREERELQKLEPAWSFMIRTRTPGGVLSAAQWLAMDAIAARYGGGSLRLTTRQALQFHGIIKHELKATLQAINAALIDTIAACGDVNRNVLVGCDVYGDPLHAELLADARALSQQLLPRSRAYYQIWLDEEQVAGEPEEEPVYGPSYLPRKFKIGFALPPANDIDLYAQDLGFAAVVEAGELIGYNLSLGGGLGASHGDARTYPRLADSVGYLPRAALLKVGEAVLTTQRDLGNRSDRKLSRFKYTIDRLGLAAVLAEIEARAGLRLQPARPIRYTRQGDAFGWQTLRDGRLGLGLRIEAGRVVDRPGRSQLSGLRALAQAGIGEFHLTPNQNLRLHGIDPARRAEVDALLAAHGLDAHLRLAPVRLNALACVALPTCPLAMAEAERYLPEFGARVQQLLASHGLGQADIGLRLSGCPNGCSRPYLAEIALIGKAPGRYNLHLGGDRLGLRLNRLYRENQDEAQILGLLDEALGRYRAQGEAGEGFGDFAARVLLASQPAPSPAPVVLS